MGGGGGGEGFSAWLTRDLNTMSQYCRRNCLWQLDTRRSAVVLSGVFVAELILCGSLTTETGLPNSATVHHIILSSGGFVEALTGNESKFLSLE